MISGVIKVDNLLNKMTADLATLIKARELDNPMMIGIRTGGVWLAEHLHQQLDLQSPLGTLDISFYRDDFSRAGLNPKVQPSVLPSATEDRHVILVDDVIMSGRTIRAAMNELFDYGRPASITLVTMLDLNRRELPIQADVVGDILQLADDEQVKLTGPEPLALEIRKKSNL
ncbi:MAG: bifunctional pyr operon transcriptional regulator/uracil phosphoribosyltransferase PyrR [Amphritea sp.]|jgi:pyrimidine operon attenuation protein/uracil phosphoribosyltransferase|uniref:bifunctional pyr operon transcriptional regulator/uracil phosphoribosyltransferase PyrR n=1 Tax=Amphritea sp. TaxID=1872502 RepID=UPI001B574DF3|nr:bifunctional pyr operon transcriptional regulator/uracil phosphoribosyltransferase PyrR [Amphritea sp.]MBQ0757531.1 bifunctional pyr operon transcriptional regulator/uracil phosphoribosyltransferase PyrR [Amphritea sp.]MBQ0783481.1 bifunctional pyr operon transcriptional regulator/uracil phosphoribosyltransferase PyrR [Amphritea sp.]